MTTTDTDTGAMTDEQLFAQMLNNQGTDEQEAEGSAPETEEPDEVNIGADEDTDEEKTYLIVGEYEADIESCKLNMKSPLARALIGKDEGDSIEVSTPGGVRSYEILKITYK